MATAADVDGGGVFRWVYAGRNREVAAAVLGRRKLG
jgi:hypothetical protein